MCTETNVLPPYEEQEDPEEIRRITEERSKIQPLKQSRASVISQMGIGDTEAHGM